MLTETSTKADWVEHMRETHGEDCTNMSKGEIIQRASKLEGRDYSNSVSPRVAEERAVKDIRASGKVTIHVPSTDTDGGNRPVFVSVNAIAFLIQRDVDVEVPRAVYEALKNARQKVYRQEEDGSLTPREVPSYPFSVVA